MARRRKAGVEVSLFPFLSVLVCMIGALTLLIVALALGGSEPEKPDDTPPYVAPEQAKRAKQEGERAVLETTVDVTEKLLEVNQKLLDELLASLRDITQLQDRLQGEIDEGRDQVDAISDSEANLTQELALLLARIAEETKKLEAAKDRAAAREAVGTHKVVIPPGKHKYKPLFVLCRADGLVILPTNRRIPTDSIGKSKVIKNLLKDLRTSGNWCLFLLVHERGVKAFNQIYWRARQQKIPCGLHAVSTDEGLDVGDFERPAWLR